MGKIDTARHYYQVMRSEVVEHIRLRDQSLFLYLGAAAVIMGIGFGEPGKREVLMIIPFLGLGASYILNQHDIHIGAICTYLTSELDVFLNEGEEKVPQWDSSTALADMHSRLVRFRYNGHLMILLLPMIVGLGENYPTRGLWWWLGVAAVIIVVMMTVETKRLRGQAGR